MDELERNFPGESEMARRMRSFDWTQTTLGGRELARRIRAEDSAGEVLLVAISRWGTPVDVEDSLACGFDHHLVKPVDLTTIARLCSEGRA